MDILTSGQTVIQTPAHNYSATADFSVILDDMKRGELPVGTGQPFPVNFDVDQNMSSLDSMSPFVAHRTGNLQEPSRNEIIGPHAFGL